MSTKRNQKKGVKHIDLALEVKAINEDGTFSGYASVFGEVDQGRDMVMPGAFAKTISDIAKSGRPLPILWQHDTYNPIGVITLMKEDERGLYIEGKLATESGVTQADAAHALLQMKAITGMSIGYTTVKYSVDEATGVRSLIELELWEISLVTFPMNTSARIDAVKGALEDGHLPTLPEFEGFLREAGFSKTQAIAIAGKGLSHLLRSESAQGKQANNLLNALSDFKL